MNLRKGWLVIVLLVGSALLVSMSSTAGAQGTGTGKGTTPGSSGTEAEQKAKAPVSTGPADTKTADGTPIYKPPLRGSPGGRVGGGTRGASLESLVSLSVLVPDHVGLTLQSQPHLYWFISKITPHPVEFTITEKDAVKPVLEARLKPLERAGIQCIRLSDLGVRLRPNVPYKWFVAVVTDPDRRSRDTLSGGMIEVLSPSAELSAKLRQTPKAKQPFALAQEGIWYDALAGVSDSIDASPKDLSLRKQRAALLDQVGLKEAAEFDLKEARSGQ
jgi:Domain of Unknown Function (DUF928)